MPIKAGNVVTFSQIQPIKYAAMTKIVILNSSPLRLKGSPSSAYSMPHVRRTVTQEVILINAKELHLLKSIIL